MYMQITSETTARQRLCGQPNLVPRSSALLPVRIMTARRPDHIRLSALVRSRYTQFIVHASSQLVHDPPKRGHFSAGVLPAILAGFLFFLAGFLIVSFDFNVSYSSCWGYSLINTLKLKNKIKQTSQMLDVWLQHVCLDLQHEDSLRRQSPRCQNVWRREKSDVVETSPAHICQLIGGGIYQRYKNCVSHFDESYGKQRGPLGNVHMCIEVWLEIGCSRCKGGWVQSPVVTSGCRGWAQFFSWNQKINLFHLLSFFDCILFLVSPLLLVSLTLSLDLWFCWFHSPLFSEFSHGHTKKKHPAKKKSRQKTKYSNSTGKYVTFT